MPSQRGDRTEFVGALRGNHLGAGTGWHYSSWRSDEAVAASRPRLPVWEFPGAVQEFQRAARPAKPVTLFLAAEGVSLAELAEALLKLAIFRSSRFARPGFEGSEQLNEDWETGEMGPAERRDFLINTLPLPVPAPLVEVDF